MTYNIMIYVQYSENDLFKTIAKYRKILFYIQIDSDYSKLSFHQYLPQVFYLLLLFAVLHHCKKAIVCSH